MENLENLFMSNLNYDINFEKMLEFVFKECPDGIVFKDNNLCYRVANQAFCDCFKIKNIKDYIGKKDASFLNFENQKLVKEVSENVLKELKPTSYIISQNLDSDSVLSITSTPIIINNKFIGIISMIKDITYEECIKQQFVTKHFQIKSLLENIPMIIYMQDKDLNYIAGTKYSKEFVKNGFDTLSNVQININKSIDEIINENEYVIKNNKILIKEKEVFDIKENKHWYKIYKVPITNFNGNVTGIITLANNIDEEKQLQAQRETFVATLGHDLKNPTIAQIRSLELLLKGSFGEINNEQKELLEMILDSCRYMNGMLSSLLATYRNYNGVIKLNFADFSFSELVEECVSEMVYVAKDKSVNIFINNKNKNNIIQGDRVQIKRVVMNLLSNGIKYAFPNTVLNLNLNSKDKSIIFEFENESPYIPEEKQKAIFAQYVSYASTYKELGIGLGLYASKKIIEGHRGKIYMQSYKDNRNSFGFKIPIAQKADTKDNNIML